MLKKHKAIIVGTSLTGKTTLIKYLRKMTNLSIQEIDEEIVRLNGKKWPKEDNYKNTVLVPPIKKKVLASENLLFFTNTNYFTIADLLEAKKKGFKIIQLLVDKKELEKRNKQRMEKGGYEDHSQWFDSMLQYQKEITEEKIVDKIINADRTTEEIAKELVLCLENT